jgi:hypothetical protein
MASFLSDQLTNDAAQPVVKNNPSTANHSTRIFFSWTGDAAQDDTVKLRTLKKGMRVMGGRIGYTAFGASVTLTLGDGTTAAKYLGSTSIASAGASDFANTIALSGLGKDGELSSDVTLTATLGGADPASGSLYGYVDVLVV